jgi:hypothetical protein
MNWSTVSLKFLHLEDLRLIYVADLNSRFASEIDRISSPIIPRETSPIPWVESTPAINVGAPDNTPRHLDDDDSLTNGDDAPSITDKRRNRLSMSFFGGGKGGGQNNDNLSQTSFMSGSNGKVSNDNSSFTDVAENDDVFGHSRRVSRSRSLKRSQSKSDAKIAKLTGRDHSNPKPTSRGGLSDRRSSSVDRPDTSEGLGSNPLADKVDSVKRRISMLKLGKKGSKASVKVDSVLEE